MHTGKWMKLILMEPSLSKSNLSKSKSLERKERRKAKNEYYGYRRIWLHWL